MSTNPLSPSALLQGMADALPTHAQGDTTSDLSSSHDALALFAHTCMTSLGFRLTGFDESKNDEARCRDLAPRLPENWNASFNNCTFVYAHSQSALRFVLKVDRMGGKAEIRGLAINDDRIARVEVTIKNFISNGALPVRITLTPDSTEDQTEDRSDLSQKLQAVFIDEARITDLASLIKINIIQKLLPSLQKEGYEESPDDRAAREDDEGAGRHPPRQPVMPQPMPPPAQPNPYGGPVDPPPRRPVPAGDFPPPEFEDELEVNRPPRGFPPGASPFGNLGADDLNPPGLGPNDPFRPSLGGLPRPGGHRGMHPTFGDIGGGGIGAEPYDPQAPPGARFDPLGPGGMPRLGGHRPGGGNNPYGGFGGFGGDII